MASPPPSERSSSGRTVRERLVELDALRSERLVSEDEYQAKRRAILEDV